MTRRTHTRILPFLVLILIGGYLLWRMGGGLPTGPDDSGCRDRFGEEENLMGECLAGYEDCRTADGLWSQAGFYPHCILPTTDGGTPCTDSTDCQGDCLADSPAAVVGACSTMRGASGCRIIMIHGTAEMMCYE